MVNYVKFLRGSRESWNKLQNKDANTLYFIYENKDADNGQLYLGDKLISGVGEFQNLNGINVTSLSDGDMLVYNATTNSWSNKPAIRAVPIMTGAINQSDGTEGLVPRPKAGMENLFLQATGTWTDPVPQLLKKQIQDLIGLDHEMSARQIAAEEVEKLNAQLRPVTNTLSEKINQLQQESATHVTQHSFYTQVGDLTKLFNANTEAPTIVDAINEHEDRLTWRKII